MSDIIDKIRQLSYDIANSVESNNLNPFYQQILATMALYRSKLNF